jgi:hypothetical protein
MEAPKKGSSSWSTRGVVEGKSSKPSKVSFEDDNARRWHDRLVRSLHLVHKVETPPGSNNWEERSRDKIPIGSHVITKPQFDPEIVSAMDRELSRKLANWIYNSAIETARPRANAMLQEWRESDPRNNPAFKNAVRRFAAFAPEAAEMIKRGGKKTQRRRLSRKRTMRKKH